MPDVLQEYLLRIEAVNLDSFIFDSSDLSTIRGGGLLLLGLHQFLTGAAIADAKADQQAELPQTTPADGSAEGDWTAEGAAPLLRPCSRTNDGSLWILPLVYAIEISKSHVEALQEAVSRWLRRHPKLRHATFAIAIVSEPGQDSSLPDIFVSMTERTVQQVRRQQLRLPSVSPGRIHVSGGTLGAGFCDIDSRRAATVPLKEGQKAADIRTSFAKAADKNFASEATHVRRAFGRDRKIRLYHMLRQEVDTEESAETLIGREAQSQILERFTPAWEFEDIGTRTKERLSRADPAVIGGRDRWSSLNNKMAVIYIDGNQFSKQIRKLATGPELYSEIDRTIRRSRAALMRSLTDRMQEETRSYWRVRIKTGQRTVDAFRIETLMWGGDEMIWIVPAWCALETVQFFFRESQGWRLTGDGLPLTHAVGLVLCSHKSPIRSVVALARELADGAKDQIKNMFPSDQPPLYFNRPESNVVAYQVLESFDHLGEEIMSTRRRHRFPGMTDQHMVLSAQQLNELLNHLDCLRNKVRLPRSRFHQIARFLQRIPPPTWCLPDPAESGSRSETGIATSDLRWPAYEKLMRRIAQTTNSVPGCNAYEVLMKSFRDRPEPAATSATDTVSAESWDIQGQAGRAAAWWYHVVELWDYLGSADTSVIDQTEPNDSE
ncbi:MAG: hypothetical protein R3C49_03415 [Planctomycetaceae bacterium]